LTSSILEFESGVQPLNGLQMKFFKGFL